MCRNERNRNEIEWNTAEMCAVSLRPGRLVWKAGRRSKALCDWYLYLEKQDVDASDFAYENSGLSGFLEIGPSF